MNRLPQISIIILNYNTGSFTESCLNSIFENTDVSILEIIVVDNNSVERSVELLKKKFPSVKFFFRNTNDGFAGGCNFGAGEATGNYLLFLNPDVVIKEDIFPKMKEFIDQNEDAGILSGAMYDDEDRIRYFYNYFPDLSWEIAVLLPVLLDRKINKLNSVPEIKSNKSFDVDWFHGAFIFIRKKDFELIGGYNEDYFIYYEDVEICYKMKNFLDKRIICLPEIRYYHSTKSSLSNESTDDIYIFHMNRSKLLFIRNYKFLKRSGIYLAALSNIFSRILILPFWNKYKNRKLLKLHQLLKILKLYFSRSYLIKSKYEFSK